MDPTPICLTPCKKTGCGSSIVIAVILTVVIVLILAALIFWCVWNNTRNNIISKIAEANRRTCCEATEPQYPHQVYPPQTNGIYEQDLAKALWEIDAAVSLSNCEDLLPIPTPPPFTHQLRIEAPDPYNGQKHMFAYVFWNTTSACFAFTGTFYASEWGDDLNFKQIPPTKLNGYECGTLVHTGFYQIYLAVRCQLWNWWTEHGAGIENLYISGHSLGAACSVLCSYDFADHSPELIHYTFGSPRVGNVEFAEIFDRRVPQSIRVYNTEDAVVDVPLAALKGWIYQHVCINRGAVAFNKSLGSLALNHTVAYREFLPFCFENAAPCNNLN